MDTIRPALYEVELYDLVNGEVTSNKRYGILYADSFTSACKQLEDYYAGDLISAKVELFEEGLFEIFAEDLPRIRSLLQGIS